MVSLDEAITIIMVEDPKPLKCAFETESNFYFGYCYDDPCGYYKVDKNTGELDIFLPQDDFDEFESMRLTREF